MDSLNLEFIQTSEAMQVFGGYVARQAHKFTKCQLCQACLLGEKNDRTVYFKERDVYNVLHVPNNNLWTLLQVLNF